MATFYIQLADELLKINGDVTRENIVKALGYVPSSFSGEFKDLENNPFAENEDGEFSIIDKEGNIIAKVDGQGIHSVEFEASGHKLTEKSDVKYVDDAIDYLTEEIIDNELVIANAITNLDDRLNDIEHDFSIDVDYRNVINVPIVEDNGNEFHIADTNGYKIATFSEGGLETVKVLAKAIETTSGSNLDIVRVKVDNIEALINVDNDGVINKLTEVINYFSGVSESETALKIINDVNTLSSTTIAISGAVETILKENEEVIATTLTDLEAKLSAVSGAVETNIANIGTNSDNIQAISGQVEVLATEIDNLSGTVFTAFAENEEVIADSLNDLNSRMNAVSGNLESLSASVMSNINVISARVETLSATVQDNVKDIESISGALSTLASSEDLNEINQKIADNELVIAAAITDIDDRLCNIEQDFSIEVDHDEVINSPLTSEDDGSEFHIADTNGYKIATFSSDGLKTTKVVANTIETTSGSNLDDLVQRVGADNSNLLILSGYVKTLIQDVSANTVNIDALSGAAGTNFDNIQAISGRVEVLVTEIDNLSGTVGTNSDNIQVISGQVEALSTEIDSLSGAVFTAFAENEEVIADSLNDLNSRMNTVSGTVETNIANIQAISGQVEALSTEIDSLSGAVFTALTENEEAIATVSGVVVVLSATVVTNEKKFNSLSASVVNEIEENEETIALACTSLYKKMEMIEEHNALYPIIESEDDVFNISDFNGYVIATFASGGLSTTKVMAKDGFFQTSDETLKDFIGDVNVDFEQLKSIPKKYYIWKDDNEQNRQIGTSAQKVKEVYPELVTTNELTGKLSVDYAKLSVLSLKAIDMLHEENQMLKRELQEIKEKLGLK